VREVASPAGPAPFVPPPYPYERLAGARSLAAAHQGGVVDLSVGTPGDPPPQAVVDALSSSGAERGYPPSVGSPALREAARAWLQRRFGVEVPEEAVAACVGTKELVASAAQWLRLRHPGRDTILYPELSYPTYAMGATLAGCRAVPVPLTGRQGAVLDLAAVDPVDAERALALWVNSPANPTGALEDLGAAAAWGRAHGVPVLSDECYVEFTWRGRARTILEEGLDGVLAVHTLSKRSNLAGLRVGFYAGDPDLVGYLGEVRKHAGLMVPGPVQAAAVVALEDDHHVSLQRQRYRQRLERFSPILERLGLEVSLPEGGFYLWARAPGQSPAEGDGSRLAWAWTERLARQGGVLVSPGDLYGLSGSSHVRVAMVAPMERLELVARRLATA
jgi:succinyldiaminopimelate transaminase